MTEDAWLNAEARCLGLRLAGDMINDTDERGNPIVDDTLLILVNAHHEVISFVLPTHHTEHRWECLLDTREATGQPKEAQIDHDMPYELDARSLALFRTVELPEEEL